MAAAAAEAQANLGREITEANAVVGVGSLPVVLADRGQMGQVFQNLLSNAVKFHGERPPNVSVSWRDAGTEWEFAVQDNGIGIDPKHAERIFGVFKRLHTEQEYPGTGIGLALCRRIIERHGGRIWHEPAEDGGSIFRFTLPKQPPTRFELPARTEDEEA
jgi:light-regulated signal transduction histidine kinase (bacteriophytochrome)